MKVEKLLNIEETDDKFLEFTQNSNAVHTNRNRPCHRSMWLVYAVNYIYRNYINRHQRTYLQV